MGDSFAPKHIFDGSIYGIWEPRMKMELQACNLWQTMSKNQVTPTEAKTLEVYNNKNKLATFMIFRVFSNEVLLIILTSTSTKEAWDRLKKIYLGPKFKEDSPYFKKSCNLNKRKMKVWEST